MHCFSSSSMRCRLLERAGRVRLGEVKGCFRLGAATVAAITAVERQLDVPTVAVRRRSRTVCAAECRRDEERQDLGDGLVLRAELRQ